MQDRRVPSSPCRGSSPRTEKIRERFRRRRFLTGRCSGFCDLQCVGMDAGGRPRPTARNGALRNLGLRGANLAFRRLGVFGSALYRPRGRRHLAWVAGHARAQQGSHAEGKRLAWISRAIAVAGFMVMLGLTYATGWALPLRKPHPDLVRGVRSLSVRTVREERCATRFRLSSAYAPKPCLPDRRAARSPASSSSGSRRPAKSFAFRARVALVDHGLDARLVHLARAAREVGRSGRGRSRGARSPGAR